VCVVPIRTRLLHACCITQTPDQVFAILVPLSRERTACTCRCGATHTQTHTHTHTLYQICSRKVLAARVHARGLQHLHTHTYTHTHTHTHTHTGPGAACGYRELAYITFDESRLCAVVTAVSIPVVHGVPASTPASACGSVCVCVSVFVCACVLLPPLCKRNQEIMFVLSVLRVCAR
jgi:hypothetical protein